MKKILSVVAVVLGMLATAPIANAQSNEAYPPRDVLLTVNPHACDATSITGTVTGAQPGTEVTVSLSAASGWKALAPVASDSGTADASGSMSFTLSVADGTYGTFTVTATGTNTNGDPFSVTSTVDLIECKPLPDTGSNSTGTFLNIGAVALMAGLLFVVGAARRRRYATAG